MVLSPFNNIAIRAPSEFFQPTSLLTYKLEYDFTPGTGHGVVCVNPHCTFLQGVTHSWAWFNVNKDINPGVTNSHTFSASTVTFPNQVYVSPMAGAGSVNNSPFDLSSSTFTDPTKRWMTSRVIATGIRIIPTG